MDLVSDLEWLYRQDLTKSSLGSTAVLRIKGMHGRVEEVERTSRPFVLVPKTNLSTETPLPLWPKDFVRIQGIRKTEQTNRLPS